MTESARTSAKQSIRIRTEERKKTALAMKASGFTMKQAADKLGMKHSGLRALMIRETGTCKGWAKPDETDDGR